jgi:hypothetical protein
MNRKEEIKNCNPSLRRHYPVQVYGYYLSFLQHPEAAQK